MIRNAKDVLLSSNSGTLPNMESTLLNYFQKLTFTTITKTTVNFEVVETETSVSFMGVRQPFSPQMLLMKPEGERSWKWEMIHSTPDLVLVVDDRITFGSVKYRVMQRLDYTEYGYLEYHIIADYSVPS